MEHWDKIQQGIRIALFIIGGWLFGADVAEGEMYTQFVGGVLAAGSFVWWLFWESRHKHVDK